MKIPLSVGLEIIAYKEKLSKKKDKKELKAVQKVLDILATIPDEEEL